MTAEDVIFGGLLAFTLLGLAFIAGYWISKWVNTPIDTTEFIMTTAGPKPKGTPIARIAMNSMPLEAQQFFESPEYAWLVERAREWHAYSRR
jgi:hypothetical protein